MAGKQPLMELEAAADGAHGTMDGDYTALLNEGDSAFLRSDVAGEQFSFAPVAYKGPNAGERIAALYVAGSFITGTEGPMGATSFLSMGGTEYLGTPNAFSPATARTTKDAWELNPATGVGWEISDLAALEIGVRSEA